jgi:hypothetical protein
MIFARIIPGPLKRKNRGPSVTIVTFGKSEPLV